VKLNKNDRVLFAGAIVVGLMVGLSFASVPLYSIFCKATGFGGTPQQVSAASTKASDRYVTVSFDGNVSPDLPWDFAPDVASVRVKLGETVTAAYHATNRSAHTLTGTATYNVQPDKAGAYFDKVQCFCFTRQTLKPGQRAELTVRFYVDPAMADDRRNDDVQNITLSYTFFLAKDQVARRP
jgi:cytochrome c oxidase assembly protein subunit 11